MLQKSQIRRKTIFFMSIFSLLFCQLMFATRPSANENPTPEQIYNAARIRDGKALQNYKKFINIEDENGQTALCLAQQNKDKYSYEMLLVFGADREVDCHDDKDPICAIVVGEKLKLSPAGAWILAGTATAGAIAGIAAGTDLINHHEPCPEGYSKRYKTVADCGVTGAEGWLWEDGGIHHRDQCGKCTPKEYDTGCSILYQSVADCGPHAGEGWEWSASGYSGDVWCGICTPKICPTTESPATRGSSTFYHTPYHCPIRKFMKPTAPTHAGWYGEEECFTCNYQCDEKTGFATQTACQTNAEGAIGFTCQLDPATQCYYRSHTPNPDAPDGGKNECPVTESTTTRGSSTLYNIPYHCPIIKFMKPTAPTHAGWSGDEECFTCNYQCDEETGFGSQTTCQTNDEGATGYTCQLDPSSQCYYRSHTPNPDNPDGGENECPNTDSKTTRGSSTLYNIPEHCPTIKYMKPTTPTSAGWSGEKECFTCNYQCDEETGFASQTTCQTNEAGATGYICQLDPTSGCYYRSSTPNPDNPDPGKKECPVDNAQNRIGSKIEYINQNICPTKQYMTVTGVEPGAYSGEDRCYTCLYNCDEKEGFASETTCKTNEAGAIGYTCQLDPKSGCYYRSSTPNPDNPDPGKTPCTAPFDVKYQEVSDCVKYNGGITDGWNWTQSGWSGEEKCGHCEAKACTAPSSTAYKATTDCPAIANKIAVAVQATGNYAGSDPCNECIYWCDPAQRSFSTPEACEANAAGLQCIEADGCYVIKDDCPEGYHTWIQNCNNKQHPSGWKLESNGSSNGISCNKCVEIPCSPANVTDVSTCGSTGAAGWELVSNGYSGNDLCQICQALTCPSSEETGSCSAGTYENVTATPSGNYAGNTPCYNCDYSCRNSYESKTECEAAAASTQYCKEATTNITCWYPVEYACPSGYTAGLKKEDCDTWKNGHYYDQTIVVPDDESNPSQGIDSEGNIAICYQCGFNCIGEHDNKPLVTDKTAQGYIYFEVWGNPKCYLQQLPGDGDYGQCVDQNGTIETAYPDSYIKSDGCPKIAGDGKPSNDSNWRVVEIHGYYYAGEQCYLCAQRPCSDQKTGTDTQCTQTGFAPGEVDSSITSGVATCYTCNCDTANGYYASESDVPDCADNVKTIKNYGMTCYYCGTSTASLLSLLNDTVNNQTRIVYHEEGDYQGIANINADASAPIEGNPLSGDAIGSLTLYNSASNAKIALQAGQNRTTYNAKANGTDAENTVSAKGELNLIMQDGANNVTAAGITTNDNAYNAYAEGNAIAEGRINIEDTKSATNVIYGISSERNAYNAYTNQELAQATGTININTITDKQAYGIFAAQDIYNQTDNQQTSIVNVRGTGSGDIYGLYSKSGNIYNSGEVNVSSASGNAYGLYLENGNNSQIENSGQITVSSNEKSAYGIYVKDAKDGVTVTNTGSITATGDSQSRGIKIEQNGQNATVINQGQITVNGALNAEESAIDLGGGKFANAGEIKFIGAQNLDVLNGKFTLEKGGHIEADVLSGDLTIGTSVVKEGFKDTYVEEGAIKAQDIQDLNLSSESALFTAQVKKNANENLYDAEANRRNFNEFTPNSSIGNYLENNYHQEKLAQLFEKLKSANSDAILAADILKQTGADILPNLAQENLMALRNSAEVITDAVLADNDEENRVISGADAYFQDAEAKNGVTGYDNTTATAYMFGDKRLDNKNRLGLGLSYMQMSSSYDNGGSRTQNFVSLFFPWLHKFTEKLKLASVLNFGYGWGKFDRGIGNEADLTDYIYGLSNKLIYSMNLADMAELEPALMFNVQGYTADDMNMGDLKVKQSNHLSAEAGIGLYIKKSFSDEKYGKLTARLGGAYYHEFANPYRRIRAGFADGVGSFSINDYAGIYSRDRAVLSAMLNYEYKRIALYLKYNRFIQRKNSQNLDMGVKYNF